ncbi:MAG TPA: zinc-binding protein [Chloroflexi bacterium]|nr:zinc-binding protein [Chloroflexota bacterium]
MAYPKHCHLCGRRLWGKSWLYGGDDVSADQSIVVCRQCHETAPRCDVCNRPMGEHAVQLPDRRRVCERCHRTAVYDQDHARQIFDQVVHVVTASLGLDLHVGADFTLVDAQHLQRLAQEADIGSADDPTHIVGLFVRRGRRRVMYALSGLPPAVLIQTIAHEWAHAWQGENCPLLRDPLTREGFAEWAAYKTIQALGKESHLALMERQNGLYGAGLKAMLKLERRAGLDGVLDFCRRAE